MRLCLLTDNYLPHHGGSRIYYHELLRALRGVECRLLTRAQPGDLDFDRRQPYRIERLPLEPWPLLRPLRLQHAPIYWNLYRGARRLRREFAPELWLAGELAPTGPVAACLTGRRPLVVFTHAEGPSTLARTRWQSRLARWVCRRADLIVAASDNAREGLIALLDAHPQKVRVLLPAVAEEHFEERWRAQPFRDGRPAPRLLSVGRLIERKGHDTVLRALPALLGDFPELRYDIVGRGPREPYLRDLARDLGLEERLRFLPDSEGDALHALYAGSDCFVQPNRDDPRSGDTEGFGIVFGEAAAHGLPVVGGRAGGTAHSIEHGRTGLRVDGSDPAALAAALRALLGDPQRARILGEAGRRKAQTELRWDDRARDFLEWVEPLTEARP